MQAGYKPKCNFTLHGNSRLIIYICLAINLETYLFSKFGRNMFRFIEAAVQRYFQEKVFWKYAANLQENIHAKVQKQPSRSVLRKRWTENMQQIYRRTLSPKCDFSSLVNLLHIFRTSFSKNTSGWLLLLILRQTLLGQKYLIDFTSGWKKKFQ